MYCIRGLFTTLSKIRWSNFCKNSGWKVFVKRFFTDVLQGPKKYLFLYIELIHVFILNLYCNQVVRHQACGELLLHLVWEGWNDYMEKCRPGRAGFRQYKRGRNFSHVIARYTVIYEAFRAMLGSQQNVTEFYPGQAGSCNYH